MGLALAVGVFCADATLPPALAQLTAHLAAAHRPITLLALGAALLDGWPETTTAAAVAPRQRIDRADQRFQVISLIGMAVVLVLASLF